MQIILGNEQIIIHTDTCDHDTTAKYLMYLLQSNNVNGTMTYDNTKESWTIQGFGQNLNIYHALTQIQDESQECVFVIN